ncbi:MAG: TetR/AcrR family transcriptional regulator [Pseudonocardia sp.]|nr:TetR/AcrR family transcriptional regulator [Pseudonocardia sp.]
MVSENALRLPGLEEQNRGPAAQQLLAVAARLFAEHGFDRTSVADVVRAAGVTKGALYHYFSSKDDLLFEVYGRVLRMQLQRMEELAAGEGSVTQRVRAIAADVAATSIDNIDDTMIFWRSLHQLDAPHRAEVRGQRRKYHERFRALLEEGVRDGEIRADVPLDLVIDYFFGAVHHVTMWYRPSGTLRPQQVGQYFADLLMSSLRAEGAGECVPGQVS